MSLFDSGSLAMEVSGMELWEGTEMRHRVKPELALWGKGEWCHVLYIPTGRAGKGLGTSNKHDQ